MFKFLRRHRTIVLITVAFVFVGMILFGVGTTTFSSSPTDAIVKVNGKKITQAQYEDLYRQISRQQTDLTPDQRKKLVGRVFQELIRQEVFYQEAKNFGIEVSDHELQLHLASIPAFQKEGQFDPRVYYQTVAQVFRMRPVDFEEQRRRDLASNKLNRIISYSVHIREEDFQAALKRRISIETDPERVKELKENPELFRSEMRKQEVNLAFGDWLNQLNAKLRVEIVSEDFRKRLSGAG